MTVPTPILLAADGAVLTVQGGRIARVQPGAAPPDALNGEALEAGRVCAHTHLYSGLAPLGLPAPSPPPEDFVQILERVWWRLDRALTAETLRAAARLYVAEALLDGTTTLVDHHESPRFIAGSLDLLAEACDALGARALLTYGATERNGGLAEGRVGLDECRRLISARSDRVRGLVGLHASFTASDELIREAGALCEALGVPLHVHVAEDGADVVDARRRGYAGPVERLLALGALPPGSILAHGIHLTEAQVALAAEAGAWFVQNPRSNEGNRVGWPRALTSTDRVALGTDGYPARMAEEAASGRRIAAALGEDPACIDSRLLAGPRMVSEHFGLPIGPLEEGAAADLVVRQGGAARHVVVDGRLVIRDGRLLTGDLASIRAEAQLAATALWDAMAEL